MAFRELRAALKAIDKTFLIDKISEVDVINGGDDLHEKITETRKAEKTIERIRTCRSANQVFGEFALDAAAAKVDEMLYGPTSADRQRAQETVLEYSLGKPINRTMSMTMRVSDASEEELDSDIRQLLTELNFTPGQGAASSLLIGDEGVQGEIEASTLPSKSRVSGKVHQESEEGSDLPDG